jgi:uracil-DNA glycosylase
MVKFGNDWDGVLSCEFEKEYYLALRQFLRHEYGGYTVYPDMNDIFNALKTTAYSAVKAVILGQDPYHNPGQAHGMCFSVKNGIPPPSLVNIYKEIDGNIKGEGKGIRNGDLTAWARQGVLLLNTVLTVRQNSPLSHRDKGWETFTDAVICALNKREKPVVFLLWGSHAQKKAALITERRHHILRAAHPSPLSAFNGFFGCGHFAKTNEILKISGEKEINW